MKLTNMFKTAIAEIKGFWPVIVFYGKMAVILFIAALMGIIYNVSYQYGYKEGMMNTMEALSDFKVAAETGQYKDRLERQHAVLVLIDGVLDKCNPYNPEWTLMEEEEALQRFQRPYYTLFMK